MIRSSLCTVGLAVLLGGTLSLDLGCSSTGGTSPGDGAGAGDGGAGDATPPVLDASAAADLGMNDVSVLLPLPKTLAAEGYLTPDTAGRGGVLLPQDVYGRIPVFTPTVSNFERGTLKALAIRFDGCFRKEKTDPCEAQIRIVMQPIASDLVGGGGAAGDSVEAMDSAVHLFYRLSESELPKVVTELRKLRSLTHDPSTNLPLQVSPSLAADGVDGPYGKALFNLVRGYVGAANLVRVTFFLRTPSRADEWDFGGFVKSGAEWKPLGIPGVGDKQRVTLPTAVAPEYQYRAEPVATAPEDLTVPFSSDEMAKATAPNREAAVAAIMRVENPNMHSADSIQCVACHVARPIGSTAESQYGIKLASFKDTYTSPSGRNLSLFEAPSLGSFSVLRAFGWGGGTPAISRRVVHETAEVLDDLDRRFPKPAQ